MNATKLCSIENCNTAGQLRRGYCEKHYRRWLGYGDPLTTHRFDTPEESFKSRAKWQGNCLIWTGGKNRKGYGSITVKGQSMRVHRFVWERSNGSIPEDKIVDHICHKRDCVNIEHLRLVTPQQNSANRSGPEHRNAESGIRNVYKSGPNWMVRIVKNGKRHYLGTYNNVEEAKRVAAQGRQRLFGEYAGKG